MMDLLIEPLVILHLTAPNLDEMVARMKRRAAKEGRQDDTDEQVIRRRFEVYESETAPVLDHYDRAIVRDIDAIGTIDAVAARIAAVVDPIKETVFSDASGWTDGPR